MENGADWHMVFTFDKWISISQPVQYTTTVAENSNLIVEGQKKLF